MRGYLKVPVFASKLNTLNHEQFLWSSNVFRLISSVFVDGELRERGGVFLKREKYKKKNLNRERGRGREDI